VDVVICFLAAFYTPVMVCGRLLGKKVISYEPGTEFMVADYVYGTGLSGRLIKGFLAVTRDLNRALADRCVIESLHLVEQNGLHRYRNKVRWAHLYVDKDFYTVRTAFELRPAVVGYVGRLMGGKGIPELLNAAMELRDTGVRFQLVGDGPLLEAVTSMLKRPEMSHVDLLTSTDRQGIVRCLNSFQLLVLPTLAEGLPNVLLEAMACGTPVLATAVGGIQDLVTDGVTGFTLPRADAHTIALAILRCLEREDLAAVAERGRAHVSRSYSLSASAAKWEAVLKELLSPVADKTTQRVA